MYGGLYMCCWALCFKLLTKSIGKRTVYAPPPFATRIATLPAFAISQCTYPFSYTTFLQTLAKIYCVWKCVDFNSKVLTPPYALYLSLFFACSRSRSRSRSRSLGMSYGCQVGFISMSFAHCLVKLSCVALYVFLARFCLILQSDFRIFTEHQLRARLDSTRVEQSTDLWPPLMYVCPFSLTLHFRKEITKAKIKIKTRLHASLSRSLGLPYFLCSAVSINKWLHG